MSTDLLNHVSYILRGELSTAVSQEVLCEAKKHGLLSLLNLSSDQAVWKFLQFNYEYEELTAFLEEQGIWYLPMKGILLREYYPHPWQRDYCDFDILINPNKRDQVIDWFLRRGYSHVCETNCDGFVKKPVLNFEIHKMLFEPETPWYEYFSLEKYGERIKKDGYRRYLSDEDFYIYNIIHWLKHFTYAGTGLRTIVDEYLFLQAKESVLNWEYIKSELSSISASMGIAPLVFEEQLRTVSLKALRREALSNEENEFLKLFENAGTYGTHEKKLQNSIQKHGEGSKTKYLLRRAFPPLTWYQEHHPFLYRFKVLIPFFCVYRILAGAFTKASQVQHEMKIVLNTERDESDD